MAMLISRATGNFTAAATWGVADSATGSQLTNPSASTNTTTSYVYSSTFTGTNTRVADGIALFLKRLTTTGTVTVALSDDNGVTATRSVTVNASDLPADESWVFFKFGTTLTLDGGTDYRVGVIASDADNALIYRNATAGNWARMVSTTTTGAPAATDTMLIVGEWTGAGASSSYTVTMDNTTTTDFGTNVTASAPSQTNPQIFNGVQIGQNGTLTWGTSATTNYYLKISGLLTVWSGGTYNMGSSGTPCPRDSTMTLEFDSIGNTGNNQFSAYLFNGSVFNVYGQSRTSGKSIFSCKLSANAAVNDTSLTIDADTGWLDNDRVAVASTTRTASESETGLLNGAAGASTLTVDGFAGVGGGLAFAHSGTSPTQAEIILLTRNVIIKGVSTSAYAGFNTFGSSQVTVRWALFNFMSTWPSPTGTGIFDVQYCSFWTSNSIVFAGSSIATSNVTFSNNVGYIFNNGVQVNHNTSGGSNTFQNNIIIQNTTGGTAFSISPASSDVNAGTFSNNTAVGGSSGFSITSNRYTVDNITAHSQMSTGITLTAPHLITNCTAWRVSDAGIMLGNNGTAFSGTSEINTFTAFGSNFNVAYTGAFRLYEGIIAGDTSFSSSVGLGRWTSANAIAVGFANIVNCSFSPTSGIYVPHTLADIDLTTNAMRVQFNLSNVALRAATEVANTSNLSPYGFIKSSKHDQTEGAFKSWFQSGVIERDTTIFNTAAPSERLTPTSTTIKLASGSRLVAVDDGSTITINAYVRKSATGDGAAYNGNQPRLIVRANPACGITTDTVLDTMTVGTGTWEQLTGTTAAVDADGALEFYVDCDGTAGWVNVDDWSVT